MHLNWAKLLLKVDMSMVIKSWSCKIPIFIYQFSHLRKRAPCILLQHMGLKANDLENVNIFSETPRARAGAMGIW